MSNKYYTTRKKDDMITAMITLWKDAEKDFRANPDDRFARGRYTAALDLLQMVPIYEREAK